MKRHFKLCAIFLFFLSAALFADDEWRWNLVNALTQNDLQAVDKIIKENVKTMTAADRKLVMNFALTYSRGNNVAKTVEILKGYNIRPDSYDLYTAINRNQSDSVIQLLLDNGIKANGEILLLAMEKQKFSVAKQFIETGADVNYQYPLNKNYADGMTPLLYASKWDNFDLVKLLVEKGAKLNTKNKDGSTALSLARANENWQVYNYLLEKGAVESSNPVIPPPHDSQAVFQAGTYKIFNGSTTRKFIGNAVSGSISYARDGTALNGIYKAESGYVTATMEGRTYIYKIESGPSLSGNGEIWVRMGN